MLALFSACVGMCVCVCVCVLWEATRGRVLLVCFDELCPPCARLVSD